MRNKQLNRICPICGNKTGNILGNVQMSLGSGVKLPNEYDITTCTICGFAYADTTSTQKDYNAYYASDNCYAYEGDLRKKRKSRLIDNQVSFLQKYVDVNESIIDIGCGSGDLLVALKNRGYHYLCGLDPAQSSIARLKKLGISGVQKNMFEAWEGKYDVLLVSAVLEHIYDLNEFINICLSHLNSHGKIYIQVPAVEGFEKYYQSKPNYFNHEHINYFSKISLSNLLGKHGCKAILSSNTGEYFINESSVGYELVLQNIFVYDKSLEYELKKDIQSERSIVNYLRQYENEEKSLIKLVEAGGKGHDRVVWGAGSLSMQLMVNEEFARSVVFFVDNNQAKIGKDICGKKVYSPEILYNEKYADLPILVCCMQYVDDIVKQIYEMQIKNEVIIYNDMHID